MMRLALALCAVLTAGSVAARAETYFCTPIGVAEMIGEPGPLTIPSADPERDAPIVFWIDTATGHYQEHFEGGNAFITGEGDYRVDVNEPQEVFRARLVAQEWDLFIDTEVTLSPYYIVRHAALAELGTCVPAPMGQLP